MNGVAAGSTGEASYVAVVGAQREGGLRFLIMLADVGQCLLPQAVEVFLAVGAYRQALGRPRDVDREAFARTHRSGCLVSPATSPSSASAAGRSSKIKARISASAGRLSSPTRESSLAAAS